MTSSLIEFQIHLRLKNEFGENDIGLSRKKAKDLTDLIINRMNKGESKNWITISSEGLENDFYREDYLNKQYPLMEKGYDKLECPYCFETCFPEYKKSNENIVYTTHSCKTDFIINQSSHFEIDIDGDVVIKGNKV